MAHAPFRATRTIAAFVACVAALVGMLSAGRTHAEPAVTLDGRWSAGPLSVRWVLGDWGAACGPKPAGGGEAGASVTIKEGNGELTITGGGRSYSTMQCWEQYPGIQRTGHSASRRSWKTSCRTSPGDPRQASLSTSLTATDTSISFYEAGQYQFVIQGQNCTASVGRYRTYTLVQRAGALETAPPLASVPVKAPAQPPAAKAPETPPPTVPERCKKPGAPARLDVRPARKLLRAGEEFAFRAVVFDGGGCVLGARPTWALDSGGEHAEVSPTGTVHVAPDAPEGEVRLSASVGGRSAVVTIEVASTDRYDALLHSGAFNAAGEVDEAASVAIASQSIGAAATTAEDHASGRKRIFVALVGLVAVTLGIVAALLVRRTRRAVKAQDEREAAQRAKRNAAALAAAERAAQAVPATAVAHTPNAAQEAPPAPAAVVTKKICPMCGTHYPGQSSFCGKDGATLLPLN